VRCGQPPDAINQLLYVCDVGRIRQHQREKRPPGNRAHRRDVAQIDGQGPVADVLRRRQAPLEVHAFDLNIGRQDHPLVAARGDDRRVVSNPEDDGGGLAARGVKSCPNTSEQLSLVELRNRHIRLGAQQLGEPRFGKTAPALPCGEDC
jgi:hypothetical protein